MDDERIIELYFSRDEYAIDATASKYGGLLSVLSRNILPNDDADECVNDTYLAAWNAIPPTRPRSLSAYLCRIVRNLSINRYRANKRRVSLYSATPIDELSECIPDGDRDAADDLALRDALNEFLRGLPERERNLFLKRYFYMYSLSDLSREIGLTESNVKVILHRTRVSLREYLERKEIHI